MSDPGGRPGTDPEVGSLAEETARLLGALSGWAREHGGLAEDVADDLATKASEALRDVADHAGDRAAPDASGLSADHAAECTWCPVCRGVSAVRSLSPEVRQHLAAAASSLVQAAAGLLATAVPDPRERPADVEHIDLDEVGTDWEDHA